MSKPTVDLELKKAFLELQVKMIETSKKINDIDAEISTLCRTLNLIKVNLFGISNVPPKTNTYETVGRIFIRSDLGKLKKKLQEREAELNALISQQNDKKKYLELNLKESEDNIREMVQLRKEQIEPKSN